MNIFNDTATTEIYTLSLRDALPISGSEPAADDIHTRARGHEWNKDELGDRADHERRDRRCRLLDALGKRSEEHTSELQSRQYLVCRLLLDRKYHITIFLFNLLLIIF